MNTQPYTTPVQHTTLSERRMFEGKKVTTTTSIPFKSGRRDVTREYTVIEARRRKQDGPLMLRVGNIDSPLGQIGMWIEAESATLVE